MNESPSQETIAAQNTIVILVNYANPSDTLACLKALAKLTPQPRRIIVVDNRSPDDSVPQLMQGWRALVPPILLHEKSMHMPALKEGRHIVLACARNGGFAAGNNAAIRLALQDSACQAVWLLNNDALPDPEALNYLCQRLYQHPRAGIVGSTLVYAHDKTTVQTLGGESFCPWMGLSSYMGNGNTLALAKLLHSQAAVEAKLASITGASMCIRRQVLEQIGLLDESYFLYVEELDYCTRARRAGFLLAWAPGSIVYHKQGSSTGAHGGRDAVRPAWIDYLLLRNRIFLIRRHYPWALPLVLLSYLAVLVNRVRRIQIRRIALVCRSAWDGLCGRMGPPDTYKGMRE